MKKIFSLVVFLAFFVCSFFGTASAFEGDIKDTVVFNYYSSIPSTEAYSSAIKVSKYKNKQAMVYGMYDASTFGNLSGTWAFEVSHSPTGPWVAAKNPQGNAITGTTNGQVWWEDAASYVRVKWTRTKHRVYVWFRQAGNN